jgi:hypothetical protein
VIVLQFLLNGLALSHHNQEVWLQSYYDKKRGIENVTTFQKSPLVNTLHCMKMGLLSHSHNVHVNNQKR